MTERLEGGPVAQALDRASRERLARGTALGWPGPVLVSLHRGEATPYAFYLRRQATAAARIGLGFRPMALPVGAGARELDATLAELDSDPAVHGVIVEHPLPAPFDFGRSLSALRVDKDVDGVGWGSLGRLVDGRPIHVPAVALAALAILAHYEIPTARRRIAVIGRSASVGLPTALRLLAKGPTGDATVTVVHSQTRSLGESLAGSDVIVSCAGVPGLLTRAVVPKGSVLIDVGLSSVPDPARPGAQKAVGDADPADLDGWAAALTPTPGGVGPVTVAELMASALTAWERAEEGAR